VDDDRATARLALVPVFAAAFFAGFFLTSFFFATFVPAAGFRATLEVDCDRTAPCETPAKYKVNKQTRKRIATRLIIFLSISYIVVRRMYPL
jgi:hypothetical protein